MKKIIGNLDMETARIYADLISRGILEEKSGSQFSVAFNNGHAVRFPHATTKDAEKKLVHEYKIGKEFERLGIHVPKGYGVFVSDEVPEGYDAFFNTGLPFLVEEYLDLIPYRQLNVEQRQRAEKQFDKQTTIMKENGFVPEDVGIIPESVSIFDNVFYNCGVRRKDGNLYFFGFKDYKRRENLKCKDN